VRHAFPVVAALHALATRLGATELGPDDYELLRRANEDLAQAMATGDVSAAIDADDRFHCRFVTLARNPELKAALDRVMPKVRRLEFARFGSLPGRTSPAQHDRIIDACRRDVAQAARLVEENWLTLGDLISHSFE
jgi:DNA-binding GntR family transcriptional regulator